MELERLADDGCPLHEEPKTIQEHLEAHWPRSPYNVIMKHEALQVLERAVRSILKERG